MNFNLKELPQLNLTDDIFIAGITCDSKMVAKNYAFFAICGTASDGRKFIEQAVKLGASVIIYEPNEDYNYPSQLNDVHYLKTDNSRLLLALTANKIYQPQPLFITAITGTNGKTSTADFYRQITQNLGLESASVGTLGAIVKGKELPGYYGLTTPDPIKLNNLLNAVKLIGVDYLAIEASSHGLNQYRLNGISFSAGAFTNLSQDHLDYHGSMEEYLNAKLKLFTDHIKPGGVAVLNSDIPEYEHIKSICIQKNLKIIDYGKSAKVLKINNLENNVSSQKIDFNYLEQNFKVSTSIIGEFQAYNILCAIGLLVSCNIDINLAASGIEHLVNTPGRMQRVSIDANIFVDFSHTPDSLEKALLLLKPLCTGRLITIIGCGGDRDKIKRPIMGKIACQIADIVIVSDDNPRFENAATIRAEILAGCNDNATQALDRASAIKYGIELMQENDILLIAGKGHEQGQIIGDITHPFDDVEVARQILSKKG
jgi:UDP-N-acetylmuramoyl-L-alanyl-D-glutamate--2,6-diaminopimelate ligase